MRELRGTVWHFSNKTCGAGLFEPGAGAKDYMDETEMYIVCKRLAIAIGAAMFIATFIAAARADDAARNYREFCADCHGATGQGNGPHYATLQVRLHSFRECDRLERLSSEQIFSIIRNGGAASGLSSEMPAWAGEFDAAQIRGLVSYLRRFCTDGAGRDGEADTDGSTGR